MNAPALAVSIVVLLAVVMLPACSGTESAENIGPRLHRECVSIVNAALAVAPAEFREELRSKRNREAMIFDCILTRGNAGSEASR
jgi:hypothetical protein